MVPRLVVRVARAAIVGALVAFALVGCLRFTSDLEIHADDTVSGAYVIAVVTGTGQQAATTDRELAEDLWETTGLAGEIPGASIADYSRDGYTGISVTFERAPLSVFAPTSERWGITREGSEFVVSGPVSGAGELPSTGDADETDAPAPDVRIELTFPGPVTRANGSIAGNTVTWAVTSDEMQLEARADDRPATNRGGTFVLLVLGVVAATAVAYWLAGVVGRARRGEVRRPGTMRP